MTKQDKLQELLAAWDDRDGDRVKLLVMERIDARWGEGKGQHWVSNANEWFLACAHLMLERANIDREYQTEESFRWRGK